MRCIVGITGFEPATSWRFCQVLYQAELYPGGYAYDLTPSHTHNPNTHERVRVIVA